MERTVSFYTLGCRVNQYESSLFAQLLSEHNIKVVPFGKACDISVVNTCTVTSESDRKSRQVIRRAAKNSKIGVIVTGCFAEISPDEAGMIDGVIDVVGNKNKNETVNAVLSALGFDVIRKSCDKFAECSGKLTVPGRVRTFIKIEDGCESKCAYCIIPKARGPIRSKKPEKIIEEASALVSNGSPEIILTGIEISAYGKDFPKDQKYGLEDLIYDLSTIPDLKRLALGSLDPTLITDRFLKKVLASPKLIRHFHISLQSGSSSVLRRMRRKYNADMAIGFINSIRRQIPDANISADIICGFPGETIEEFEETCNFCRKADFLNLHIFPYSIREGTEAALMEDQHTETEKKRRVNILEEIHRGTQKELLQRYCNTHNSVNVLFEQKKDGYLIGHTEHYVELRVDGPECLVGKICPVKPNSDGTGELIK